MTNFFLEKVVDVCFHATHLTVATILHCKERGIFAWRYVGIVHLSKMLLAQDAYFPVATLVV